VEAAEHLGRDADARQYCLLAEKVQAACERELWDGQWYIRGITAKGVKIGTSDSEEGKVFIESNTWAVVSDAASPKRGVASMDAVDRYLYSPYGIHLLWPAFSKPNDDIGFVARVYKGIKENAAIFSHPNPWAVIAECKLGRGSRAMKFYDSLLPYNQNDLIEKREAEPYSYCQFVMGRDHTAYGRARHPWLTGSGGWNYTAATRWILGIRLSFEGLIVDPCIPSGWREFEVVRQWRGATFRIAVRNPDGVEKGVRSVSLDGQAVVGAIPPQERGSTHEVNVVMG
jgi:N,N'-diacetylchitobiose phosphorylase